MESSRRAARAGEDSGDRRVREIYDQVPYPAVPHALSHPDRLATLARLHGLESAPVDRCRVLELGCANGANLIPMAQNLPGSSFLGIDLSARQVEVGNRLIHQLGLKNINLRPMSLLDFREEEGPFDYIITHGLYSWVDRPVQDRILELCQQNLAPRGVAYVSYNLLPGWYLKLMVRDMAMYHTREMARGLDRAEVALGFLGELQERLEAREDFPAEYLKVFIREVKEHPDWRAYFLHDYLADINVPCYFHEFIERARVFGLQYITDADPTAWLSDENHQGTSLGARAGNRAQAEQYSDYLHHRSFRRSLLCHHDQTVTEKPKADVIQSLYAASSAQPLTTDKERAETASDLRFATASGSSFTSQHPIATETLLCLASVWPRARFFDDILEHLRNSTNRKERVDDTPLKPLLTDLLLSLFRRGVVELQTTPPLCPRLIEKCPKASPLARIQAGQGRKVTNLRHQIVNMDDDAGHFLLLHLDGTRDLDGLVRILEQAAIDGRLDMQYQGRPVLEQENAKVILQQLVLRCLSVMTKQALLAE